MINKKAFLIVKKKQVHKSHLKEELHDEKVINSYIKCPECCLTFYDKYTLLFHLALEHNRTDHLCPKCYGVFALIDSHIAKCDLPFSNEKDKNKIHNNILNRKKKRNNRQKNNNNNISSNEKEINEIKNEKSQTIKKTKTTNDYNKQKFSKIDDFLKNNINTDEKNLTINFIDNINKYYINKEIDKDTIDKNRNVFISSKLITKSEININLKSDNLKPKTFKNNLCFKNVDSFSLIKKEKIKKAKETKFEIKSLKIIKIKGDNFIGKEGDKTELNKIKKEKENANIKKKELRNDAKEQFIKLVKNYTLIDLSKYLIFKELIIGEGAYGKVNFGIMKKNFEEIAIKRIDRKKVSERAIDREAGIIQRLKDTKLFPLIFDFKRDDPFYYYIIESLQGPDLKKFFSFSGKIDINTAYRIGIELLINLKTLHNKGFIHVDLKEDNIASMTKPIKINDHFIHFTLIDFGFSLKFKNEQGIHYEPNELLKNCGNFYYASINSLSENPISRKDDIISVIYMILCWCLGKAPWMNVYGKTQKEYRQNILKFKKDMDISALCKSRFEELIEIYNEVNLLNFKNEPQYEKYIEILLRKIKKTNVNVENANYFCWEDKIKKKISKIKENHENLEDDKEIKDLFVGYSKEYIVNFLEYNFNC